MTLKTDIEMGKIICGYSEQVLKEIPDNSVDLVFTSPPYAERRKNTYGGIKEDEIKSRIDKKLKSKEKMIF